MKFSTQEDMDRPISDVFEMLSTFEDLEAAAVRRGATVQRLDDLPVPGVGMKWQTQFVMRGQGRVLDMEMIKYDPPNGIVLDMVSQGLQGETQVDLTALSETRTRIAVGVEVRPKTMAMRLLLRSLKLTKASLTHRFKERVARHLKDMEQQYNSKA